MMQNFQNTSKIAFDKLEIFKSLAKKGEYKDEKTKTLIKKWEDGEVTSNLFIIQITNGLPFLGVINGMFEREGFGVNTYKNGDIYFGYFSEDKRNKHGIYSYKPKIENNFISSEYYYGLWKDDYRNEYGVYLWLKENINIISFSDFENAIFTAYVGNIDQDVFTKGTLLIKNENDNFIYHGSFNKEGKKEGDLCFFYSLKKNILIYGYFQNDIFISGHFATFNSEGNIINLCKCNQGKIINRNENNQEVEQILINFRKVIMSKDYFRNIYEVFGQAIKFRENNKNNIEIFNSGYYIDIINAAVGYNKISIFRNIENKLKMEVLSN
jgi:hypothetical protein